VLLLLLLLLPVSCLGYCCWDETSKGNLEPQQEHLFIVIQTAVTLCSFPSLRASPSTVSLGPKTDLARLC
jgi:hypothetical protein